ncbi:MAG: DNA translocase FtsK 4TM domain-containing protein, partial [Deltaproteobacteria bacterium]|nr:DNA translocase FtsK 4TM domain-containing protein [Deltaproteobacteria bacterium]
MASRKSLTMEAQRRPEPSAVKRAKRRKELEKVRKPRRPAGIPPEVPALCAVILGVATFLALISHAAGDLSSPAPKALSNHLGLFGAYMSAGLIKAFGAGAFWPVPVLIFWAMIKLKNPKKGRAAQRLVGLSAAVFALLAFLAIVWPEISLTILWPGEVLSGGGAAGAFLSSGLVSAIGRVGSAALLPLAFIASVMLALSLTPSAVKGFFSNLFERLSIEGVPEAAAPEPKIAKPPRALAEPEDESLSSLVAEPIIVERPKAERAPKAKSPPKAKPKMEGSPYELPGEDLLDNPADKPGGHSSGLSREELTKNARLLEAKLMEFGVEGRVLEVSGGPVITLYEYQPAPGIKIAKVAALNNDLNMAMRSAIRVVAPIPGKAAIGFEIPNPVRAVVTLKEVIESETFRDSSSPLTLVLGVDLTGRPVVADLGKMPHLLIAGATGSGKSVGLDCMIMSILYKAGPELVRFLMIDPKCVEMAMYQDLPHLLHPVLTDPEEATVALKWAVHEMDLRYKLMAEKGVRNIAGFNDAVRSEAAKALKNGADPPALMPYLVIIIDELSDLMLTSAKDVEVSITRLAAKARAAGMHLILATQRPSVDVLTGVIKANLPTRLSFQVATKVDSKTILDRMGAEQLLGKGDMLFMPPGTAKLHRLHGAYVSDE